MNWWVFGIGWVLCLIARVGIAFAIEQAIEEEKQRQLVGCAFFPITMPLSIVQVICGVGAAYLLLVQWGWL